MSNHELLQKLSNEMYHDFEKALEAAETEEDEIFWENKIEALEKYITVLQSTIDVDTKDLQTA